MTTEFTPFPRPPQGSRDPAIKLLYQRGADRITNVTGLTLTLSFEPVDGTLVLFKNMTLVDVDDPTVCTIDGKTLTLGVAAVSGDVYVAQYHYRQGSS